MPSAGDWTLHRGGAVTIEGVVSARLEGCAFNRLDGNGVSINGYLRNVSIQLTAYCIRLTAYGLRLTACGLRLTACGLWLTAYGLRLAA